MDYSSSESSPTTTEIGTSSGADANTVDANDIFIIGSNVYVFDSEGRSATVKWVVWDVDTAPFTEKATVNNGDSDTFSAFGIVTGNNYYTYTSGLNFIDVIEYDDTGPTLTLHSAGQSLNGYELSDDLNQRGTAYDGLNIIFLLGEFTSGDNNIYLIQYSISGVSFTPKGQFNIALMLDRNIVSGGFEKAYHLTEDKIYQLITKQTNQLYLISNVSPSQSNWNAITDNLLQDEGGNMFEFKDLSSEVYDAEISHGRMNTPFANMRISDTIKISSGMFIQLTDQFTSAGNSTANAVVFEGLVQEFTEEPLQEVSIRSQAIEIDNIFPAGDFSGSSQSIINSLITTLASYITPGTLAAGQAMGT
ncbi:hypothetical protein LCGC14_2331020, partial [marine sediment metagenome]